MVTKRMGLSLGMGSSPPHSGLPYNRRLHSWKCPRTALSLSS